MRSSARPLPQPRLARLLEERAGELGVCIGRGHEVVGATRRDPHRQTHDRPANALLIRPDAHIAWAATIDESADNSAPRCEKRPPVGSAPPEMSLHEGSKP
ncbi:aromatic-ring hydroxylase C-terminal domain-containing protein [Streptomyces chattanoogensis]